MKASWQRLPRADEQYQLSSGGVFDDRRDYLRIDNTLLTPGEVAERVIEHFGLPRSTGFPPQR